MRQLTIWASFLAGSLCLVPVLRSGEKPFFLGGQVIDASGTRGTVERRLDSAAAEFRKSGGGKSFFAAYEFTSRTKIHRGRDFRPVEGYVVNLRGSRIRIQDKEPGKHEVSDEAYRKDSPSPAVLLLLRDPAAGGPILDVSVLDPEESYEFSAIPVYWLGTAEHAESLSFLQRSFDAGKAGPEDPETRRDLLFAISLHPGRQAYEILKKAALGPEDDKVRETAIFWLGNYGDAESLADLKEIYAGAKSDSIKKQVIFALQLSRRKEAVEELIRIARRDPSQEARKQAVFWLGQKATAESVKALEDIVEGPAEESTLKEQAVFAISQLPKDKSVPMLIDIASSNKSLSVRKKAMFWLGQSGDPAALQFFEEILLKK